MRPLGGVEESEFRTAFGIPWPTTWADELATQLRVAGDAPVVIVAASAQLEEHRHSLVRALPGLAELASSNAHLAVVGLTRAAPHGVTFDESAVVACLDFFAHINGRRRIPQGILAVIAKATREGWIEFDQTRAWELAHDQPSAEALVNVLWNVLGSTGHALDANGLATIVGAELLKSSLPDPRRVFRALIRRLSGLDL
jgi:hypothetical protein